MAQVYADLIRKGKKTIEEVPEKLRAEVEAILNAQAAAYFITKKGDRNYGSYLRNTYCEGKEDLRAGPGQNQRTGTSGAD